MSEWREDICWTVTQDAIDLKCEAWSSGDREFPAKIEFSHNEALALLLLNEVVFLNNNWWKKDWPPEAQQAFSVNVICNDTFGWACADAEPLPFNELEALFRMWKRDASGPTAWCILRRKQLPIEPVAKYMREGGVWDVDALARGEYTAPPETP